MRNKVVLGRASVGRQIYPNGSNKKKTKRIQRSYTEGRRNRNFKTRKMEGVERARGSQTKDSMA